MKGAFYLAFRYLAYHKGKTAILITSITLMLFLPAAMRILVQNSAKKMRERATSTPLVMGAMKSPLELVLNTLYFRLNDLEEIPYSQYEELRTEQTGKAIPLHVRFHSRGIPIVGTTLSYFPYRGLSLQQGNWMGILGECVVGANISKERDLTIGSSIISSPETLLDLAGVYPLKMRVAGILKPRGTPDDGAIFVDIRTSWVIAGLGHGHEKLDQATLLSNSGKVAVANASVTLYNEITEDNAPDFHFHGSLDDYPVTALLIDPTNQKASALLQGRHDTIVVPKNIVEELLDTVFTIQNYILFGLALLSASTVAVVILVFMLSKQLRKGELATLGRIGVSPWHVTTLITSEILFVVTASVLLAFVLTQLSSSLSQQLFERVML